jgi:hypothetical protein
MNKSVLSFVLCSILVLASACGTATTLPTPTPTSLTVPAVQPTETPQVTAVEPTATPQPAATLTSRPTTPPTATAPAASTPTPAPSGSFGYPPPPTALPADLPPTQPLNQYVAFAWNNLGMHCFQKDFSMFLILPPYNVFWTQVLSRGREPRITTSGLSAQYAAPQVTDPAAHTDYWQYAADYSYPSTPGVGVTGIETSGTMSAAGDHFIADGVPMVDITDAGIWDPYPFFTVDVHDSAGNTVVSTLNTAPVSTEMSCYICHKGNTLQESMAAILETHDKNEGTDLYSQAQAGNPKACNTCHADPALGVTTNQGATTTLSGAMHTYHASRMDETGVPANICLSCHPGPQTECQRGAMAKAGITCTDCHGTMSDVGDPARTPWVNLPMCQSCHTANLVKADVKSIANPNQHLTASESALYRNSKAHGGGGIYCPACHGSPHAIYPSSLALDNEQSIRLQGSAGTIADCTVCHVQRPRESFFHLRERD